MGPQIIDTLLIYPCKKTLLKCNILFHNLINSVTSNLKKKKKNEIKKKKIVYVCIREQIYIFILPVSHHTYLQKKKIFAKFQISTKFIG